MTPESRAWFREMVDRYEHNLGGMLLTVTHWNLGIHSGIPECCVRHFVDRRVAMDLTGDERPLADMVFKEYGLNSHQVPGEYVLCPECIVRYMAGQHDHIVEIHYCDRRNDPTCERFWSELEAVYALA